MSARRARAAAITDQSAPIVDGLVHEAYANPRVDVVAVVPAHAVDVLDVGCSVGAMGEALTTRGCKVTGIESDPQLAALARPKLVDVIEADAERLARDDDDLGGRTFDCVIFADVLEHMREPWPVVQWGARRVAPGGSIVISVPNIRHAKTFWTLAVRRRWPYEAVGIFDRTHLRFFAKENLPELVSGTGFEITEVTRSRLLTLNFGSRWNKLARFCGDLGTLQFIFRAERTGAAT